MGKTFQALIAVGVLLVGCGGGSSPLAVEGTLTLAKTGVYQPPGGVVDGGGCTGMSGFDDIRAGAQVTVTDEKGAVVATTQLEKGAGHNQDCVFPFSVKVPDGKSFYRFEVSHRGTITVPRSDLASKGYKVSITLG